MSDQLVGIWILTLLGQDRILDDKKVIILSEYFH